MISPQLAMIAFKSFNFLDYFYMHVVGYPSTDSNYDVPVIRHAEVDHNYPAACFPTLTLEIRPLPKRAISLSTACLFDVTMFF